MIVVNKSAKWKEVSTFRALTFSLEMTKVRARVLLGTKSVFTRRKPRVSLLIPGPDLQCLSHTSMGSQRL
ncbi:hypothetical protein EUGRSUZ_H00602 [Eucalyptus grandis]|uniref:Uncharacterized protein n=2 Tax=Eucalyptus grandis TaxID=71139 RepID=A0ACC3JM92_EUCGR|nr:hypothetical protein EUGRSUZ_H00602 [Eucalyptus grandis]